MRVAILILLMAALLPATAIQVGHADTSDADGAWNRHDRVKALESRLSREREKLKTFDSYERDVLGQLSELEEEISRKKRELAGVKRHIEEARKEMAGVEARRRDLRRSLDDIEKTVTRKLIALYKYARRGYMRILASSQGIGEFRQRVKYMGILMERDRRLLDELSERRRADERENSRIEATLATMGAEREEEQARLAALEHDLNAKVVRLMNIHREKVFYETAVKELESAATDLKKTLARITRDDSAPIPANGKFEELKGRLPMPVAGRAVRTHTPSDTSDPDSRKGVFIETDPGSQVCAILPGRVDFSGILKGYGQMVIINHGSRVFTISGLLARRLKVEGDMVAHGEPIGVTASGGSGTEGRLYFEIRRGGEELDPFAWLKLK